MQLALSLYAVTVFAILWLGLLVAIAIDRTMLEQAWGWLRGLPLIPQVGLWVLFLPITVGLWAWQADLGSAVRLLVGAGLVGWTLLAISSLIGAVRGPG